jgi:hypothetical protein
MPGVLTRLEGVNLTRRRGEAEENAEYTNRQGIGFDRGRQSHRAERGVSGDLAASHRGARVTTRSVSGFGTGVGGSGTGSAIEAGVGDGVAYGEMVDHLALGGGQGEITVDFVVVEGSDAGGA